MNLSAVKIKIISFIKNVNLIHVAVFVGIIILIEAVWAYGILVSSNSNSNQTQTQTANPDPVVKPLNTISLTAQKSEFKIGEKIPVAVNISSDKTTAGADLIIKYDPNLLTVAANSDKTPVAVGTIYENYPVNKVDEKTGMIAVSGITGKTGGLVPKGVFGTIIFQGKASGNAKVFMEFTKGNTGDTNIIENQTAKDVLEEVKNLDLKITP